MSKPMAMVVEDDQAVSDILSRALQDAGFRIELFSNGHEAQARLMFTTPELVLLDIHLPSLSGEVLLRQLSGQKKFASVRTIIVTGDPDAAEKHQAEGYQTLLKPIGYEQLRTLAEELIPSQ